MTIDGCYQCHLGSSSGLLADEDAEMHDDQGCCWLMDLSRFQLGVDRPLLADIRVHDAAFVRILRIHYVATMKMRGGCEMRDLDNLTYLLADQTRLYCTAKQF